MTKNSTIFASEVVGTFGLLVAATGSIAYDGSVGFALGIGFISAMHFVGLFIVVLLFGRYSMAHFNPAVTIGFMISGHLRPRTAPVYFAAQAAGAVSGSLFVRYVFGNHAKIGLNAPNYQIDILTIFGAETLATVFLMGGILLAISIRGMRSAAIAAVVGGIVALDVLFMAQISGASMNPIRSLSPAVALLFDGMLQGSAGSDAAPGIFQDMWLYWTAPFIGAVIPAAVYCKARSGRAK